jgi:hypothetical protein
LAIKHTLYRTSGDSQIVASLAAAAQSGKQVTVVIELKARFDEAANINWAKTLQEAGAHVVYGIVGLKTHAKLALVVRREEKGIRRYLHLGTGNYNQSTAKLYEDFGLLTCDPDITNDSAELFNWLTGVSVFPGLKQIKAAPKALNEFVLEMIEREIDHAKSGKPAAIFAKVNALVDEETIKGLYKASQAGCLLPAPKSAWSERQHNRSEHRRKIFGAQPDLPFRKRQQSRSLFRECGLDGEELFPSRGDLFSGPRRGTPCADRSNPRYLWWNDISHRHWTPFPNQTYPNRPET